MKHTQFKLTYIDYTRQILQLPVTNILFALNKFLQQNNIYFNRLYLQNSSTNFIDTRGILGGGGV
jgi:hypothetical protein